MPAAAVNCESKSHCTKRIPMAVRLLQKGCRIELLANQAESPGCSRSGWRIRNEGRASIARP